MTQFIMAPNLSHNIRKNCAIFNAVYAAYIEAVYFTDTEFDNPEQPDPDCEMSQHAQFIAMSDCADFLAQCADFEGENLLEQFSTSGKTWDSFGVDFWLTRNRHGAGFWDRGLAELGDKLSGISKGMGSRDTYLGEDGFIYFG